MSSQRLDQPVRSVQLDEETEKELRGAYQQWEDEGFLIEADDDDDDYYLAEGYGPNDMDGALGDEPPAKPAPPQEAPKRLPFDIVDAEGIWMSQYDYPRRIVTLSRVEESLAANGWALSSFIRVDELSDPHGRFEVFVSNDDGIQHGSERRTGTIMKVVARLDDAGYLAAWHPDFQEYMLCEGTFWGLFIYGDIRDHLGDDQTLAHWTYTSRGSIARTENLRSWSEAYPAWRRAE